MDSQNFSDLLFEKKVIVADGATGTNLIQRGLEQGVTDFSKNLLFTLNVLANMVQLQCLSNDLNMFSKCKKKLSEHTIYANFMFDMSVSNVAKMLGEVQLKSRLYPLDP